MNTHEQNSHLSAEECAVVKSYAAASGNENAKTLLERPHSEQHTLILHLDKLGTSLQKKLKERAAPKASKLKLETSMYSGATHESLSKWLLEINWTLLAQDLKSPQLWIFFAISKLKSLAKE